MHKHTAARRRLLALLLACLCLSGIAPLGLAEEGPPPYQTLADFAGAKIATQTGTVFDASIDKVIENVEHQYYNDLPAQAEAVRSGRAAAACMDEPVARLLVAAQTDLAIFPEVVEDDTYGFAFRKGDPLAEKASEVIEKLEADGTAAEIAARWFSADEAARVLPELTYRDDFDGSAGTLRFGYDPVVEPMVYAGAGGEPVGYDIELMMRIAYELNMTLELVPTSLSARIEALNAGVTDVAGCCLSITEERKKSVDFTVPYYIGGMVLVVRAADLPQGAATGRIEKPADLAGRKVGILTGSTYDAILQETIPDAIPEYFNVFTDIMAALDAGHIDAYLSDEPLARISTLRNPSATYLPDTLREESYATIFNKEQMALRDAYNAELAALYADGTMERLDTKWFAAEDDGKTIEPVATTGENGVLRMAVDTIAEPFSYVSHGEIVGLDIELATIISARLGYTLEILPMDFVAIIPGIISGKYDLAAGCITETPERAEMVLFSDATYKGGVVVCIRNEAAPEALGFWASLTESFNKTFVVENRYRLILSGLWVTLIISVLSVVFGTILGFGLCLMRRSRHAV